MFDQPTLLVVRNNDVVCPSPESELTVTSKLRTRIRRQHHRRPPSQKGRKFNRRVASAIVSLPSRIATRSTMLANTMRWYVL
jgi:hypothetical protein